MARPQRPHPDAVVTAGDARFQVLTPTLIRAEYASDGDFEDRPTFFATDRDFPTPTFDARVEDGWLVIDTGEAELRYDQGSGPFTERNLSVTVDVDGEEQTGAPSWNGEVCDAADAALADGAERVDAGIALGGGSATWTVEVPAEDPYQFAVQCADEATVEVTAGDETVSVETTAGGAGRAALELDEGEHEVTVSGDATVEVAAMAGIGVTPSEDEANVGGWYRDLDGDSGEVETWDGLLSRDGYFLLDDSDTAVETEDWVEARDRDDVYQDGYLFAYGHDYERALREFRELTGPAPLLPKWVFGNWFSRYYPYSVEEYQEDLLPDFREHDIPLDVLVVDTDWKAPKIPGVKGAGASWSGWNWDRDLFPDPNAFFDWTDDEGLHTVMNIHPSIYVRDPKAPLADHIAGGLDEGYFVGPDYADAYVWDWADPDDVDSYFSLHEEFDREGNELWWLDWLADASEVSVPGLTPDAWINHLYARRREEFHGRGFAFSRIGAEYTTDGLNSTGPWADHRDTLHFTGDAAPRWEMLDFQTNLVIQEGGGIGVPYVSHDIGSHTGGRLDPELYVRWLQSGVFQPVLRLHSVPGGLRLPWQYEGEAREVGADFLRLRHALIPYLYTVAREAHDTGLPMCRGLYLAHPDHEPAYEYDREFLLGDDVLVAPIGHPSERTDEADPTFTVGVRSEAEDADFENCYAPAFYSGFSGSCYVDGVDDEATVTWDFEDVPRDDEYDLVLRYSNHAEGGEEPSDATVHLDVDGDRQETLTLAPTDSWHDWATVRTTVSLPEGDSEVTLSGDEGAPNVDYVAVVETGEDVPPMASPDPVPPAERDVWFPPGEWVDYFTGETYEGPTEATLEFPIERMPVFVRAGGVVPQQPYMDHVDQKPVDPLVLRAFPGDDGRFDLYEDEGTGDGYESGDYAVTPVTYTEGVDADGHDDAAAVLTVDPTDGDYPGMPDSRGYEVEFVDADRPETVTVDGETVAERDSDGEGEGWYHEDGSLYVRVASRDRDESVTVAHS